MVPLGLGEGLGEWELGGDASLMVRVKLGP